MLNHAVEKDHSTIASLHPSQPFEIHHNRLKNAIRYQGSHLLSLRRPSRTPAASRKYIFGDPIKFIDWKAFARTDQLMIREMRDEATAKVVIMIEGSSTMNWPDSSVPPEIAIYTPKKIETAFRIGMHIASVHLGVGDMVEVWFQVPKSVAKFSDANFYRFFPRSPADIVSLFLGVERAQFRFDELMNVFQIRPYEIREADIGYWLGDCLNFDPTKEFLPFMRKSVLVHILSSLEAEIEWVEKTSSYFDESTDRREFQGQTLLDADNYRLGLGRWIERMGKEVKKSGGYYQLVTDRTKINSYLSFFQSTAEV